MAFPNPPVQEYPLFKVVVVGDNAYKIAIGQTILQGPPGPAGADGGDGGGGAGVTDGDKGDVTVSESGAVWTVDELSNKVDKVAGKGLSTEDYSTLEKSKLSGIATGATANDTDANLKNRANHTGTQLAATISDFQPGVSANTDVAAMKAIIGDGISDGDAVVDTLAEMLATFTTYAEGVDIATQLAGKAPTAHNHAGTDITSGTIADARLSSNIPKKDTANAFTAKQQVTISTEGTIAGFGANDAVDLITLAYVTGETRIKGAPYGPFVLVGGDAQNLVLRVASGNNITCETNFVGAFIPPKLTTTQRDALTPIAGMVIFNTTTNELNIRGASWEGLANTTALAAKQATLVSATNIKTINGSSVLGSGDLVIAGGSFSYGKSLVMASGVFNTNSLY